MNATANIITIKTTSGQLVDVRPTGQTTTGKNNGETYIAVEVVRYGVNLHSRGKAPIIGFGKAQWVRQSLVQN